MVGLLLVLALACGDPAPPQLSAAAQAAAIRDGSPEACARLSSEAAIGSCTALGANARAAAGDVPGAWAVCQAMAAGPWRDECHFLVTDTAGVVGEEARAWCQHAGAFRLQCVGHALSREARPLLAAHPRGEEATVSAALTALTARYVGAAQAPEKAHQLLVDHLAERDPGRPFHARICGTAPPRSCEDAYIERVKRAAAGPGEPWRAACGRSVSLERARQTGQPLWEPDVQSVVAAAWARLCAR